MFFLKQPTLSAHFQSAKPSCSPINPRWWPSHSKQLFLPSFPSVDCIDECYFIITSNTLKLKINKYSSPQCGRTKGLSYLTKIGAMQEEKKLIFCVWIPGTAWYNYVVSGASCPHKTTIYSTACFCCALQAWGLFFLSFFLFFFFWWQALLVPLGKPERCYCWFCWCYLNKNLLDSSKMKNK